jgi:hypothetical protein
MVSKTIFNQFISLGEQDRVNSESSAGMGKEAFILERIMYKVTLCVVYGMFLLTLHWWS